MTKQQIVENAVKWAVGIAKDNSHGYNNTGTNSWGSEYNCIGLVMSAFNNNGLNLGKCNIGKMPDVLLSKGFEECTKEVNFKTGKGIKKGYILWTYDKNKGHGHTELCSKEGYLVGARQDLDGKKGDSSGHEIEEIKYWNDNWQKCFRLKGAYTTAATTTTKKVATTTTTTTTKKVVTKTYIVQCGVFSIKENADKLKKNLIKAGFEAIVYKKGENYYVQCGSFSIKNNADKLAAKIKAKGFPTLIRTV